MIAPQFADIFYNNSLKNGLLPVALPEEVVNALYDTVEAKPSFQITVDLPSQTVTFENGESHAFQIDPFRKLCLLEGVDDLGYIMKREEIIAGFEAKKPY